MRNRLHHIATIVFCALVGASTPFALAQDTNAYLYLVHAASGRDLSASTNPEFPIDISANGTCIAKGLSFGDVRGPFAAPAGAVAFNISKANSVNPCSEPAIFIAETPLAASATYVGVVSLDASNNVSGQIFEADLSPLAIGQTRALVINATQDSLSATVTPDPRTDGSGGQFNVAPGTLGEAVPPGGVQYTSIYSGGTNTLEAGPIMIETLARNVYIYVFAGSSSNGSVQLIGPKVIRGVF